MSYVRFDDQHENGRLTEFRERLSGEVQMQTGESFSIFQDRNDILWGQHWKERIVDSIDAVTFLIPIIDTQLNSQGTLEDNEIFRNGSIGVVIKIGGNPTLRNNRINRNSYQAVLIYKGGAGIIEDNDLRNNAEGAWNISADSAPNVKRARNQEE
ncbi:MAG: right-handed parallel beta-helix repeat-containing protein [Pyrinomonadaceae bacterium]